MIGYMATRDPQPLEERDPTDLEWWEDDGFDEEEWVPGRQRLMKITAIVLSASLLLAGVGTVLEIVLSAK